MNAVRTVNAISSCRHLTAPDALLAVSVPMYSVGRIHAVLAVVRLAAILTFVFRRVVSVRLIGRVGAVASERCT